MAFARVTWFVVIWPLCDLRGLGPRHILRFTCNAYALEVVEYILHVVALGTF